MARRRKKGSRHRRAKTYSVGMMFGFGKYAYDAYKAVEGSAPERKMDNLLTALTGMRVGSVATDGSTLQWDTDVFIKTWKEPAIGIVVSKVLPKIPIVKTLPKQIPFVGKYLRW